jgi:hypothetical protein
MEKVTLTKLYEMLAQKVGRNEAECLTQYVELKVKDELNSKTEILATKVFVKDEFHALKENIHALRNETHSLFFALKDEMHGLQNEVNKHSLSQQKWMLSTLITFVIMFIGLFATILLKH